MSKMVLLADSGRPKEVLEDWRSRLATASLVWNDYIRSKGAVGAYAWPNSPPSFLVFKGEPPEGWTKPKARGECRPKANRKDLIAEMEALPRVESIDEVALSLGVPTAVSVRREERLIRSQRFGRGVEAWQVAWTGGGGPVLLVGEDFLTTVVDLTARYPNDLVSLDTGAAATIPDGFRRISEAEMDLMFAEARVKREREAVGADATHNDGPSP